MSDKNKKQFGVWMDSHHAIVVGRSGDDSEFAVMAHITNDGAEPNTNENTFHNHERTTTQQFFKVIASKMANIDEIHLTGTGQAQEQFMKYLAGTAHYKNAIATESTANKMSDENLAKFIRKHFDEKPDA